MINILSFCAGFTLYAVCHISYFIVKAMIHKIEQERIRNALKTPDLPIRALKAKRRANSPDYAVREQGDWRVQP